MMEKKLHWGLISTYRQEIMGIACLWVIFYHNTFNWPFALEPIRKLATYGNAGVDIFLFLSGISLYFAYSKKPQLGSFYKRRVIRLLIPYTLLAVPYWIWKDIYLRKGSFFLDVTMLSFLMDGIITTWYVGAILLFYLAYPLIHKLYFETDKRLGLSVNKNVIAIILPACMAALCFIANRFVPGFYKNIEIALTRSVIFLIGCKAGEWVFEKKPLRAELPWICGVFLLFYVLAFRTTVRLTDYWIRLSYAAIAISVVLLLTALLNRMHWKPLNHILIYFGNRSLELYLAHVLLKNVYLTYFSEPVLDRWCVLDYMIVIALSVVIAEVVHRVSKKIYHEFLC